jgi:hypothetical protein
MAILIASIIHDLPAVVSQLHRLTLGCTCRAACNRTAGRLLHCALNWDDCRMYRCNWTTRVTVLRCHCQSGESRSSNVNEHQRTTRLQDLRSPCPRAVLAKVSSEAFEKEREGSSFSFSHAHLQRNLCEGGVATLICKRLRVVQDGIPYI